MERSEQDRAVLEDARRFRTSVLELVDRVGALPPSREVLEETVQALRSAVEELRVVEEELLAENLALAELTAASDEEVRAAAELVEQAPVALVLVDGRGLVERVNPAAAALLNAPAAELVGKPLAAFLPTTGRRGLHAHLTALPVTGRPVQWQAVLRPLRQPPVAVVARARRLPVAPGDPPDAGTEAGARTGDGSRDRRRVLALLPVAEDRHAGAGEAALAARIGTDIGTDDASAGTSAPVAVGTGAGVRTRDAVLAAVSGVASLLTSTSTLPELLTEVARLTLPALPAAAGTSVTLLEPPGFGATDDRVTTADAVQYQLGEGPCVEAVRTGRVTRAGNVDADPRYPRSGQRIARQTGYSSVLAVPLVVRGAAVGTLNVYAMQHDAFDDIAEAAGQLVAGPVAAALANVRAREASEAQARQLAEAMASRAVIEQAKGVLMAQQAIDAGQAFDALRRSSQHTNRKLREVAADVVRRAGRDRDRDQD